MSDQPGHLVVAYHGCDWTFKEALIAGEASFKPSNNPYDWLGKGQYFFEGDWKRALLFAQRAHDDPEKKLSAKPIEKPAVVGCVLRVSRWLDMTTVEARLAYADAFNELIAQGTKLQENKAADENDSDFILRKLDRQVINRIHELRQERQEPPFEAVRSYFPQGEQVTPNSGFRVDTHVQMALLDTRCVIGYFRVREAEATRANR